MSNPNPTVSKTTILGAIADGLVTILQNNSVTVQTEISKIESEAETFILNEIKNLPKPGGVLALVLPMIESEIAAYIPTLIAQYGAPAILDALLISEAQSIAKSLGG